MNSDYDYISERLEPQMDYYGKASSKMNTKYSAFSIINFIITASIPLASLALDTYGKYITAVLGMASSIVIGLLSLKRYHDISVQYRYTKEQLKTELVFYNTNSEKYNDLDPDKSLKLLITTCESIMHNEHKKWFEINSQKDTTKV